MKQTITKILVISGLSLFAAAPAFASSVSLTNGGLGQVASNLDQFGVAVCSSGALSQSVPVKVTANGQTATISSAASIKTGTCEYSYLPYSQLALKAGQTYNVDVTVDPQHTVSSNANNETVYSMTVPGQAAATNPSNANLTANAASQVSGNWLVMLWNWLGNLFRSL